jgi:dynein heavy chain
MALDLEAVMKAKSDDVSALHVVLFQEIERYNIMLNGVRKQISELRKAVKVCTRVRVGLVYVCMYLYACMISC